MRYTTVTIGRNVGTTPMSDNRWAEFRARVSDAIGEPTFTFTGTGSWDGIEEDSVQMVWLGASDGVVTAAREALPVLRDEFGQDAIALSDGVSELI